MTGTTTAIARPRRRVGMQWKVLIAFGASFTVLFVLVAIWIMRFSTNNATERVMSQLRAASVGGGWSACRGRPRRGAR